ncbi:hypothetical protein [Leucobacter soli]|uniref:hypothetical protein n=1 Tax=Leucobacter soli TaxID=2812850 RepID=UPI00360BCED8
MGRARRRLARRGRRAAGGEYRGYDWLAGDFGDGWVALDPARPWSSRAAAP